MSAPLLSAVTERIAAAAERLRVAHDERRMKQRQQRRRRAERRRLRRLRSRPQPSLASLPIEEPEDEVTAALRAQRPRTRGECIDGPRPCPWASCRHHLAVDVRASGSLKRAYPSTSVEDLLDTCSLDIADRGGVSLERIAHALGLTRERVRQLEVRTMAKVKAAGGLRDLVSDGRRHLSVLPEPTITRARPAGGTS